MITFAIALAVGAGVGLALGLSDTCGYGWSTFFGVLAFGVAQGVGGFLVQRKVKAAMAQVQAILLALYGREEDVVIHTSEEQDVAVAARSGTGADESLRPGPLTASPVPSQGGENSR